MENFLAELSGRTFRGDRAQIRAALGPEGPDDPALSAGRNLLAHDPDSVLPADFELYLNIFDTGAYRDLAQARIDVAEARRRAIQGYVMEDGPKP